jgi:hypothetical protein
VIANCVAWDIALYMLQSEPGRFSLFTPRLVTLVDEWSVIMMTKIKKTVKEAARQLDRAITLGVASMYPLVFSVPTPDPVPDWKQVVKVGWRVVVVTVSETTRILRKTGFLKLEDSPKPGSSKNKEENQ